MTGASASSPLNNLTVKTSLDKRNSSKWIEEISQQDGVEVRLRDLGQDEYYTAYLMLTNNGSQSLTVDVSAVLNGDTLTWDDVTVDPNDTTSCYVSRGSMTNVHYNTIVWSVDGTEVATFHWTVTDVGSSSPLDFLNVTVSLDKRKDNKWIEEVSQEDGVVVSMGDLAEGEFYSPYLTVKNTSSQAVEIDISAVFDGKNISFDSSTLEANKSHNFCLSRDSATQEGSHTIVWSVNGTEVATFHWTVVKGDNWLSSADIKASLVIRTAEQYVSEATNASGSTVWFSDLKGGQYYVPYFSIVNNSGENVSATISAVLDGKTINWNETTINPGKSFVCWTQQDPGKGAHTIVWSVNGAEVATFRWTTK